jgi:predicted YcjX-like family ATPase
MKIVETDSFAGDYPDEKFLNLPLMDKEHAEKVADAINNGFPEQCSRYWKVVENDYKLLPGFEP